MRITIPSHQLVLPDYGLDKSGAYTSLDDTRNILVSRPVNDTRFGPPNKFYLGQLFLTAAYLMVNLERSPKTFTLWQNNATDVEDIVMIDSVGEVCSAEFPSKVEPSTPKNLIKSSTNSSGRIVGIVLAVLLVVLIACGVAYWYIRRRRLRQIHQKGDKRTSAIQDHKRLPDIPTSSDMALREITSEASRYHLFRLGSESYELPENHPNAAELQDSYQQNSMTPKELPALLNR